MKGYAMIKHGEAGWVNKDRPKCGPRDCICRPLALAPCTSDVHVVWENAIGEFPGRILGHEAVGIVDEVGKDVKLFKPGDKVIVGAITPDWDNEAAQRGFSSQTGGIMGAYHFTAQKDGTFAEYFHVNQADNNMAMMPDGMDPVAAVMITDMMTTGMMGAENAGIQLGADVAVIGIGPVGLCAIAGAKLRGASRIFGVGSRPVPARVAKMYGATDIIDYHNGDTAQQILDATDGVGVDAVIVAGGGPDILMDAIKMAKPGSKISNCNFFSGADTLPIPRLDWGSGMANKDIITGLCPGGRVRLERLASLITYGRFDPMPMATHVFHGIDHIEEALLMMKSKAGDVIKPVVLCE